MTSPSSSHKRLSWLSTAAALSIFGGIIVACFDTNIPDDTSGPEQPYLGPRSECSTGPAFVYNSEFPQGPRESPQPECIQRCGEHRQMLWGSSGGAGGPSPTIDSVPSGACNFDDEACSMVAVKPCCSEEGQTGQAYLFECRCKNKQWSCVANFHGGEACRCGTDEASVPPQEAGAPPDAGDMSDADSGGD